MVLVWSAPAEPAPPLAARIDDHEIPVSAVDAMSADHVQYIRARLVDVAQQAVQDLIDQRLEGTAPDLSGKRAESYRAHRVKFMLPQAEALETPLPPDGVVALVGGRPIRAVALEAAAALRLYRLRGELYLQRRRALDGLIEQRLLQSEAASRGLSLDELEASLSSEPVTEAEVAAFVARERAAGRTVANPQRVRPYLEFQKRFQRRSSLLQALRAKADIHVYLQSPERPRLAVETEGGVTLGSGSGSPVLVVYTNYACAPCRATHHELDRLLADERPPRIVLRDFVPGNDSVAMEGAALVRCAARNARAAPVRRALLRSNPPPVGQSWFTSDELESVARLAHMTPSALLECADSPGIRARIEQDTLAAHRLGFDDPPSFVAEGTPLSGMQSADRLRSALAGRSDPELVP